MKLVIVIFLYLSSLSAFAQLQEISAGVYHWRDHPVKKKRGQGIGKNTGRNVATF